MSTRDVVRFVIVSDTHRSYHQEIPNGDVWIHAGDSELSATEMDAWAGELPHAHKLVVCGNMDYRLKRGQGELKNVRYLEDSAVIIHGLKIYGSPWTPEFVGVFQLDGVERAQSVWEKVPGDVDVLVSHGPPKGILDRTSRGKRVGDEMLLEAVERVGPRVHCFGHVHESYGVEQKERTVFCNAAVFNGHRPIVVDVPVKKDLPASVVSRS